jgi:GNAT acetyltransferase-like protein
MSETYKPIIKQLGAGLILRRSSPADAEALSDFCGRIHSEEPGGFEQDVAAWTRDLLTRPHPTFHADDFTVVEETASGRIVSTLNLISQTWSYEGIRFGVGRPELVGTLPEFRNRGLIRLQFEEVHRWSLERGELVQAITGIPFYYRLFGYEMALDLDGARSGFELNVPVLKEGEREAYLLRPAAQADVPFIEETYRHGCRRYPLSCIRDRAVWYHDMTNRSEIYNSQVMIIERRNGERAGILRHLPHLSQHGPFVNLYELKPGVSWLDVTPAVVRYLWKTGADYAARDGRGSSAFTFALGEAHPVYEAFRGGLPWIRKSYAWYLRVPDLPGFLRHIAPALENRLAASIAVGYSGEKRISFYRDGLRLAFEQGKLTVVEAWKPGPKEEEGDAAFPGLTFLQLLFGYRSLDELRDSFADCWCDSDETRALLEALFPRKSSQVLPVS